MCSPAVVVLSFLFVRDCIFVSLLCLCHFFNVNFYVENIYLYYIYLRTVPLLDHLATVGQCTTCAFKLMDLDTKPEKKAAIHGMQEHFFGLDSEICQTHLSH